MQLDLEALAFGLRSAQLTAVAAPAALQLFQLPALGLQSLLQLLHVASLGVRLGRRRLLPIGIVVSLLWVGRNDCVRVLLVVVVVVVVVVGKWLQVGVA